MTKRLLCLLVGAASTCFSMQGFADAFMSVMLQGTDNWLGNMNLHNDSSQPSNPDDCVTYGLNALADNGSVSLTLGPPFSGSASRSRYATLCNRVSRDWLTVHYGVDLKNCALWVCDTKYWYQVSQEPKHLHYQLTQMNLVVSSQLNVNITDASGNWCTESTCPPGGY